MSEAVRDIEGAAAQGDASGRAAGPDTARARRSPAGRRGSGSVARSGARAARRGLPAIRGLFRPDRWKRGPWLTASALALGLLMLLHAEITDRGGAGSLVESLLPWFGLFIPVILAGALWRRSAAATAALVLPAVAWSGLFGGLLLDKSTPGGDLTVVSHNVGAENPDPVRTARDLAASGAVLLALEELTPRATVAYGKELEKSYPYRTVQGTVGLWSKLPLSDPRSVNVLRGNVGPLAESRGGQDLPVDPPRALRATVATDRGPLVVFVAHLGSVRLMPRHGFWTDSRDVGAAALAKAVAGEPNERVVVLGDMNGTTDDRVFDGLTAHLRSAQEAVGQGFGFTWPASFPMARIDQILVRGVEPRSSWVLPSTGSDHLPVGARLSW
ncbi:endonuclease/exonuclease/phosphatase family protein [Streptomyces sp. NPDC001822]|uniref:endonuclease/exonuclease/phosphatase family protein n=1 Tax=Streptomyces sp. NPDC001822 TaxID=3364614 RepID=UPI0036A1EECD